MVVDSPITSQNEAFWLGNPPMFQWHVCFKMMVDSHVKLKNMSRLHALRAFINHLWEPKCTQARLITLVHSIPFHLCSFTNKPKQTFSTNKTYIHALIWGFMGGVQFNHNGRMSKSCMRVSARLNAITCN
jgi:hypothetical protein